MGGHAGGGDDHAEAVLPGVQGEIAGLNRRAVGGKDVRLIGDAEGIELVRRFPDHRQIAVAAHDDADFLHTVSSFAFRKTAA